MLIAIVAGCLVSGHVATAVEDLPVVRPCVGVQFHAMWTDYTDAQRAAVLDKLDAAGTEWVRIDFGWSSLQPKGPNSYASWYIDRADWIVNQARARGIKVLMGLGRTPRWANGGRGVNVPPNNPADYGRVAHWLADHFKGRVSAWGVWNEPNHSYFWKGAAREYEDLVKASDWQLKSASRLGKGVA